MNKDEFGLAPFTTTGEEIPDKARPEGTGGRGPTMGRDRFTVI